MADPLAITSILNDHFGPAVTSAMQMVGVHPADSAAPIDNTFALELMVACGLILFFLFVRLTLKVEKPNPAQQIAEMIHEFTGGQGELLHSRDLDMDVFPSLPRLRDILVGEIGSGRGKRNGMFSNLATRLESSTT